MVNRIDQPVEGYYRTRLAKGGIHVGVRVWWGLPIVDDEEQDRAPRWCVSVDGKTTRDTDGVPELLDPFEVWPFLEPITADEYGFMTRRRQWAVTHQDDHPAAKPRRKIDLRQLPPAW